MTEHNEIHVVMGDVKVARRGETLVALLGSCVAIAVLWRAGGRCALAHCLLPSAPGGLPRVSGRYVDQAVPSLLKLLGAEDVAPDALEVIVVGGASMLGPARIFSAVGKLNAAAARASVAAHGLRVTHEQVGGRRGRQIRIDSQHYRYAVKTIGAIDDDCEQEQHHA